MVQSAASSNSGDSSRILALLASAFGPEAYRYLSDPMVVDILLNPDGKLWVDKLGEGMSFTGLFVAPEKASQIIYIVAAATKTTCNRERPILSAQLPGTGHRFEGQLPPAVPYPIFAIRKHTSKFIPLEHYVEQGIMSEEQKCFLVSSVHSKKNIIIGGSTGSGKTTLGRSILTEICKTGDRLIIIEDTPELECEAENVSYLRSVRDKVSMRDQLRSTLRQRPDRIIFGELRGAEAEDLLDAWGTGHPGGLTTIHCNSAKEGLSRLEALLRKAGIQDGKQIIGEAVDIIVHLERAPTAAGRRISDMLEVRWDGLNYQTEVVGS